MVPPRLLESVVAVSEGDQLLSCRRDRQGVIIRIEKKEKTKDGVCNYQTVTISTRPIWVISDCFLHQHDRLPD